MPQWMQYEMTLAFARKDKWMIIELNKSWREYLLKTGIKLKG
jgi:hypothetical protein